MYRNDSGPLMTAATSADRVELSTPRLLKAFFTHPLLTLKVIGGIHWEALKLWGKGARYRRRPAPPSVLVSHSLERAA